jgi:hypothetical protein
MIGVTKLPTEIAKTARAEGLTQYEVGAAMTNIAEHRRSAERHLAGKEEAASLLNSALKHLGSQLDSKSSTKEKLQSLWAMATACREIAPRDALEREFMRLASRSGLMAELGRHGRDDCEHVLRWAVRNLNPFESSK